MDEETRHAYERNETALREAMNSGYAREGTYFFVDGVSAGACWPQVGFKRAVRHFEEHGPGRPHFLAANIRNGQMEVLVR